MKPLLIDALKQHALGHIAKHKANLEVYLNMPVGIGEHPQHIEEVDKQIEKIANAKEKLQVLSEFEPEKTVL